MPVVTMNVLSGDISKIESEAIVACFFDDVRPLKGIAGRLDWFLCGSLSRLIIEKRLRGSLGDVALLTTRGKVPAQKLFLMGLGSYSGFSLATLGSAAKFAGASVANAGVRNAVLEYFKPDDVSDEAGITALQYGLQEGAGERDLSISLLAPDPAARERLLKLMPAGPAMERN